MNHPPIPSIDQQAVSGHYVDFDDESWYKISNVDKMQEFFISLVSSSDHWMFVSSRGALSAGRRDSNSALFPYYSADKLCDSVSNTGPKTLIRVRETGALWEPFVDQPNPQHRITRNLYKNVLGDKLQFEEVNWTLNLIFRYRWAMGHRFGFIRHSQLLNISADNVSVSVLDGIENVLPSDLDDRFQLQYSNLGDAYKKSELVGENNLGLFYLYSIPTDRAEPSEGLRATTVWHESSVADPSVLLSSSQVSSFRQAKPVQAEADMRGHRGSYLVVFDGNITANAPMNWRLVANLNQDHSDVVALREQVSQQQPDSESRWNAAVDQDMDDTHRNLIRIVSSCDGVQVGKAKLRSHRHQSNVLFNTMRGGLPINGYSISKSDFCSHVENKNKTVFDRCKSMVDDLPEEFDFGELQSRAAECNDADLSRIASEFLPLTFGRRHGDPTRPWNRFSIHSQNADGSPKLSYEGNWRDIFQNWEALAVSYPGYSCAMVLRFVNASTADGYNPYRVTSDGFDWETLDPEDPWANIGYWGDHQIVYLLRLLEMSHRVDPDALHQWMSRECCSFAQIPYRIRPFADMVDDPNKSIDFCDQQAAQIQQRVDAIGEDGKLLHDVDGNVHHVSLLEKLMIPAIVKLTNFVPDGGVWMNTQRPEWNDANNALAGNGLSVVTACYLRRYLDFLRQNVLSSDDAFAVSSEVADVLTKVKDLIQAHSGDFSDLSDESRYQIVEGLSVAGSLYRTGIYDRGFSGQTVKLSATDCRSFCDVAIDMIDQTLRSNRRVDGLYHSYNLLSMTCGSATVEHLYEMLEGQVAILSSGLLSARETVSLLDTLRESRLYREDQQSYMLYPDRELPRFLEKNLVDQKLVNRCELLGKLLEHGDQSVIVRDIRGDLHFNASFRNRDDLREALDSLEQVDQYRSMVKSGRQSVYEIFESTFNHRSFTGRSGTFFAYEGLGSIYWHMVSKLALAVAENFVDAEKAGSTDSETLNRLRDRYYEIRDGIGLTKSPEHYGAFPFDPYSHTPKHAGAQQPGMTGQVKEDILSRMIELGIRLDRGKLSFDPSLLQRSEFLAEENMLRFINSSGSLLTVKVEAGSFAFTLCQTPIVYHLSDQERLVISDDNGSTTERRELSFSREETSSLFARQGKVRRIDVFIDEQTLAS